MSGTFKWWIVIICAEDWHMIYDSYKIVRARTANEAVTKALRQRQKDSYSRYEAMALFGPFDNKPQEASV